MSTGFHRARRSEGVVCAAAEHASRRMPNGSRNFPFMKTSYPASALNQETGDSGGHVVEHVEQLVIGVENLQCPGCAGATSTLNADRWYHSTRNDNGRNVERIYHHGKGVRTAANGPGLPSVTVLAPRLDGKSHRRNS